jgi:hypothetical protein
MGKRERNAGRMRALVARWQESGQSARRFAQTAGVSVARLWYWRKRAEHTHGRPGFVPVHVLPDEATRAGGDDSFELDLGDGRRLRIPPEFSGDSLRRLLAALEPC